VVSKVSPDPDGEDSAADRIGVVRPVLLCIDRMRVVHLQDGSEAVRLLDRAHHLVDVSFRLGGGACHCRYPPETGVATGKGLRWRTFA
jgi:hypothetical protein